MDGVLRSFIRRHLSDAARVLAVFEVLEDVICSSMLDYKDQLNSSFVKFQRKFVEGQYNSFLLLNRHLIKGYCFTLLPFFMAFDKARGLQMDFKHVFFKLEFYLANFYSEYFPVVSFVFRHALCVRFVSKNRFSLLFKVLNQSILNTSFLPRNRRPLLLGTQQALDTFLSNPVDRSRSASTVQLETYKLFPLMDKE